MIAKPYDFRKPVPLPADWHQRLAAWYQGACVLANRAWAKQLPVPVEVTLGTLDAAYAQDALARLPANVIGYRVLIAGGRLPTMLVLPRLLILHGDRTARVVVECLTLVFG